MPDCESRQISYSLTAYKSVKLLELRVYSRFNTYRHEWAKGDLCLHEYVSSIIMELHVQDLV